LNTRLDDTQGTQQNCLHPAAHTRGARVADALPATDVVHMLNLEATKYVSTVQSEHAEAFNIFKNESGEHQTQLYQLSETLISNVKFAWASAVFTKETTNTSTIQLHHIIFANHRSTINMLCFGLSIKPTSAHLFYHTQWQVLLATFTQTFDKCGPSYPDGMMQM
jgi:hypothetical protein